MRWLSLFLGVFMTLLGEISAPKITKEKLCQASEFISAKLSPDGKWLAKVGADQTGIVNVRIASVEDLEKSEPLSFFKTPDIIQFFFSEDSKKVLVLKDDAGKGRVQLHGFDIASKRHLFYTERFVDANVKLIAQDKGRALLGVTHRNPKFYDLYMLDLDSGALSLVLENDSYAQFLVGADLEIALKMKINEDGSWTVFLKDGTIFLNFSAEDAFQTEFLSFDGEERLVYFLDNRFSNTNQLKAKDIDFPYEEKVLGEDALSDIDEVLFLNGKPKAYATYYTQKTWKSLDKALTSDINGLIKKVGRNFEVISQSEAGDLWVVTNSIPDQGNLFWLYDRKNGELKKIFPKEETFYAKMYEMVLQARDGKTLVCYYTLPQEYDRGGTVDGPIPLVVFPHGGPFKARDKFSFHPYHQWLASCGYAALSVNFRLSSGFGKDFVNAGNGQWGKNAHLDVIDAVEACIAKGITKPGKLAIMGGSYGGYEALASLCFSPEYFICAVAICGPSNLKTVLEHVPEFWEFTARPLSDHMMFFTKRAFITSMGGSPEEGAAYLEECSPLNYVERMKAPLLLIHGVNDHVVQENESRQIYEGMKKNHKEVIYIPFTDEGHRFGKFANKMMYLDYAERFLSKHLGGKYQPAEEKHLVGATGQAMIAAPTDEH